MQQTTLPQVIQRRNCARYVLLISFAAMIFLKDNALLERKLVPDDIKARLLGSYTLIPVPNLLKLTMFRPLGHLSGTFTGVRSPQCPHSKTESRHDLRCRARSWRTCHPCVPVDRGCP